MFMYMCGDMYMYGEYLAYEHRHVAAHPVSQPRDLVQDRATLLARRGVACVGVWGLGERQARAEPRASVVTG